MMLSPLAVAGAFLFAMSVPSGDEGIAFESLADYPADAGGAGSLVHQEEADGDGPAMYFDGNSGAADGEGVMIILADTKEEGAESLHLSMRLRLEESKLATLARRTRGTEEVGYMLYILASGHVGFRMANESESVTLRSSRAIDPADGWVDITVKWDGRIDSGPNTTLDVGGTIERGRTGIASIPVIDGDLSIGGLQRSRDGSRPGGQYFAGWLSDFSLRQLAEGEIASELRSRSDFLRLPAVFGDGMVLQRDREVPVWGWASPGANVTVDVADQSVGTTADNTGRWEVLLDPVEAGGPHELVVQSGVTRTFEDVLFGEVWLCGGQSNMEWTVRNTDEYGEELDVIRDRTLPIRQIRMDRILRAHPDRYGRATSGWKEVDEMEVSHFTAVGYHFARTIHGELDVPIGLINASWGGSRISPWMPMAALEGDERLTGYAEWVRGAHENNRLGKKYAVAAYREWLDEAEKVVERGGIAPTPPGWPSHPIHENRQTPTGMYNGMIAPLAGYGISGFLFYQGESNRQDRAFYGVLLEGLIEGWRQAWGTGELPFHFVQLAPYRHRDNPGSLPWVQDAQRRVAQRVSGVAMVVTSDVTDLDDIHPRRKREVGRRLARLALDPDHGGHAGTHSPVPLEAQLAGGTIRVRFANGEGLRTRDGMPPDSFEIGNGEGVYHPAGARLGEGEVLLDIPTGIDKPATVRFAWADPAIPNLAGATGLPASPFLITIGEAR